MTTTTSVPTGFWPQIDHQLRRIATRQPATFDAVREILLDPAYDAVADDVHHNGPQTFGADVAFFAGSGGDATLRTALLDAGWTLLWSRAGYWYAMGHTSTGEAITYVEGDVVRGNRDESGPL